MPHPTSYCAREGCMTETPDVFCDEHKPKDAKRAASRAWRAGRDRPVTCVETGEEYTSISDAAASVARSPQTICKSIKEGRAVRGRTFRFTEA